MAAKLLGKSSNSKAELLKVIDEQNVRIEHYENKLRDLVRAYKGLVKEKEVLDQSLKCLSETQAPAKARQTASGKNKSDDSGGATGDIGDEATSFTDPLNVNRPVVDTDVLKEQLATLTSALSTVTQEKSTRETSYLAEKKKLKSDNEELRKQLESERRQSEAEKRRSESDKEQTTSLSRMLQEQVGELKGKIRSLQYEREKDQSEHGLMLRELQKLLSKERMQCEQVENQCEELKQTLLEKERQGELRQQYEKRIVEMGDELQAVRERLKASEDKSELPIPMLVELQQEMGELKAQHRIQVHQEQRRANEAEDRLGQVAQESEQRVAGLEAKLSELSDVVGSYERLRQQDLMAIHKLKDQVTQLDMENTALARAAQTSDDNDDLTEDDHQDVQALADKIIKLKGLLKVANARADQPVDIEEVLKADESDCVEADQHQRCREELVQLREEFERYKLRAQSVFKNKNTKDASSGKESDGYKKQVSELVERNRTLREQMEQSELDHQVLVSDLRKSITRQNEKHAADLSNAETNYKKRMSELEHQLHKHRDRTIALLIEKDREIELLKQSCPRRRSLTPDSATTDDDVAQLSFSIADNSPMLKQLGSDAQNLFYAQEHARKDIELSAMRRSKRELEQQIRELRQAALTKEEELNEKVAKLQEDVLRQERCKSRESANLEYLKNVVYQYMTSFDKVGRHQMLNAIATILQFSPAEKEAVVQHIAGWWGGGNGSATAAAAAGKKPSSAKAVYTYSLTGT